MWHNVHEQGQLSYFPHGEQEIHSLSLEGRGPFKGRFFVYSAILAGLPLACVSAFVMPAQAGIQGLQAAPCADSSWIPACVGMTYRLFSA